MRTIIDLPADQVAALADLCARKKISRAEAVRRAVTHFLEEGHSGRQQEAFGAWSQQGDARKVVDRLRREWER